MWAVVRLAELLLKLRLSDNWRREWLGEICRDTKRLATPARDLPDVNGIQVGHLAVRLEPLPLYQAVEIALADIWPATDNIFLGHHR